MQRIARRGDVGATASVQKTFAAASATGAWAAGSVVEVTAPPAAAQGKTVVTSASCLFTFEGTLPDGKPFRTTSTISLAAAPHPLRVGGRHPLVDTDSDQDSWGNRLRVSSSATWRTS